jgi:hypothetical protein
MARALGQEIGATTNMSLAGITGTGETTGITVLEFAFSGGAIRIVPIVPVKR